MKEKYFSYIYLIWNQIIHILIIEANEITNWDKLNIKKAGGKRGEGEAFYIG